VPKDKTLRLVKSPGMGKIQDLDILHSKGGIQVFRPVCYKMGSCWGHRLEEGKISVGLRLGSCWGHRLEEVKISVGLRRLLSLAYQKGAAAQVVITRSQIKTALGLT
jgi:hypothetical protein